MSDMANQGMGESVRGETDVVPVIVADIHAIIGQDARGDGHATALKRLELAMMVQRVESMRAMNAHMRTQDPLAFDEFGIDDAVFVEAQEALRKLMTAFWQIDPS